MTENIINEPSTICSLQAISLTELTHIEYEPIPEYVEGLLTPGLYILAGTPKVGKSFFSLQLAYSLSKGKPIIGKNTTQGKVLYLALEDSPRRLQSRIFGMFGENATSDNLDLVTSAATIEGGLIKQLKEYVNDNSDTKLIIIDTLQKIRTESSTYKADYHDMGALKYFADTNNLCILLVHHTTKAKRTSAFSMIAGSQGIYGAADGAMVLYREADSNNTACLAVQGRDIPSETYYLTFDDDTMHWELDNGEERIHPAVKLLGELLEDDPEFNDDITAAELFDLLPELETDGKAKVNTITKILNDNKNVLADCYNIDFSSKRTNKGRFLHFEHLPVAS